jgi:transketolase
MNSLVTLLPELDRLNLNVKIIYATSPQLFALQSASYHRSVISPADEMDSTVITTQARWLMHDWLYTKVGEEYALSSDWDDRWRTGGRLDDVLDEAHLSPRWVLEGIQRFVNDREKRLDQLKIAIEDALD